MSFFFVNIKFDEKEENQTKKRRTQLMEISFPLIKMIIVFFREIVERLNIYDNGCFMIFINCSFDERFDFGLNKKSSFGF